MVSAKEIIVKPIDSKTANNFIIRHHYSGKVVQNSKLHLGCFLNDKLNGVMQFGSSLDKSKIQGLVKNTAWNEFIELNRMAFNDYLPKNSESRCISVAIRLIKKHYPNIKWIVSFADGCQCGDGTIYRASGFLLTSIKRTRDFYILPNGESYTTLTCKLHGYAGQLTKVCSRKLFNSIVGSNFSSPLRIRKLMNAIGAKQLNGYSLRYIYFIDKNKINDLMVPILPFSRIKELNAGMYKGIKRS